MSFRSPIAPFIVRPRSSAVLAVLLVCLGVIMVSGLVPVSPNRRYFPGHEWLLAMVCWLLAALFGYCAQQGLKQRSDRRRP